ncbi:hypothetical protein ElyMa_000698700, partial [Elysia marginata]
MLCALSQFLDRNAHVAESQPALETPNYEIKTNRRDSFLDAFNSTPRSRKKDSSDVWDNIKLQFTSLRSRGRLLDLSSLRAFLVQGKSSVSSQQSDLDSDKADGDSKKDEDTGSEDETAAGAPSLRLSENFFVPES